MFWARVDNRLIHGQIIESWLPYTGAKLLVVADDSLAADPLRQEIMSLAIPREVTPVFATIAGLADVLRGGAKTDWPNALVLFADCFAARAAFENGLHFSDLNIGNLHYAEGKRQVLAHVALSCEDTLCLKFLQHEGVELDFRCVPNERVHLRVSDI